MTGEKNYASEAYELCEGLKSEGFDSRAGVPSVEVRRMLEKCLSSIIASDPNGTGGILFQKSCELLAIFQELDLDADAPNRSMPVVDGPHIGDQDLSFIGTEPALLRKLTAVELSDSNICGDEFNHDVAVAGPSTFVERINGSARIAPLGLTTDKLAAHDGNTSSARVIFTDQATVVPHGTDDPTLIVSEHVGHAGSGAVAATTVNKGKQKLDDVAGAVKGLAADNQDKTGAGGPAEVMTNKAYDVEDRLENGPADEHCYGSSRHSSHGSSSIERRKHFTTALTWSSVIVMVLVAVEVALAAIITTLDVTEPHHGAHAALAYLDFANNAVRNLGPLLLIIVGIYHERSRSIDHVNLRLFLAMITVFLLSLAAAVGFASCGWLVWAHLALDVGEVWLLLTTLFYFQFVLKRD